ncbi:MAG: hypothetical protein FIB06_01500 [Betaproteobacteria bacterium]|nr:hypothetical protein [Betaproteobacteria bacterium]
MARTLASFMLLAALAFPSLAGAAGEIELASGGNLTITDTGYNPALPQAFHDQALASLPHLFPSHVLLASRRSGTLGEVEYALVCYMEIPASEQAILQGVAVHANRAWHVRAVAPTSAFGATLILVLEQIESLSSRPDAQRMPASARR